MKESADKKLDRLSRRLVEEAGIEQPPADFTNAIMSRVEGLRNNGVLTYRPLISKAVWLVLGIAVLAMMVISSWYASESSIKLLDVLGNYLTGYQIKLKNPIGWLQLSTSTVYAFMILIAMLVVQFRFIQNYLNRRFRADS